MNKNEIVIATMIMNKKMTCINILFKRKVQHYDKM
mgnify:FL=1